MDLQSFNFQFLTANKDSVAAALTVGQDIQYIHISKPLNYLYTLRAQLEQIVLGVNCTIYFGDTLSFSPQIEVDRMVDENHYLEAVIKYKSRFSSDGEPVVKCNLKEIISSIYLAHLQLIVKLAVKNIHAAYYKILIFSYEIN